MGNKLLKQIEEGLTSDDENDIRSSCNTLAEILESTPGKDVNWPWFMHLMGEVVSKNLRNFDSIIYTEDFHSPLRAMRKLPRKVAKKDKFQAVLRHNLTVRLVSGMFTATTQAQANVFLQTLDTLLGNSPDEDECLDRSPPQQDNKPVEKCGLYFEIWKRLLKSLVLYEREWREKEKGGGGGSQQSSSTAPKKDAALRAPAPLALLRGPIQYYQSDECLGFSIFVFHCFLSREPSGQEGAVVLQVLHDYMSCCSTDAVMRNAETALGCEGPQNQPIPHVSCTYITQMSYLLYEICMKNLRNRNAIPVCKQGLFCFPFFSHVFPETAKLLQLLDTCLPPYSESCGTDGTVTHSNFDHELHLCLRALRAHMLTSTLSSEHWWHAMVTMCAVFLSFRSHLLAEHYFAEPEVNVHVGSPADHGLSFNSASSMQPERPPSPRRQSPKTPPGTPSPQATTSWNKLVTLALKVLHVLLVQPAAAEPPAHSQLVCRLVAFLFINSKEDFNTMMMDCLQIIALKWEGTDTFDSLCKATMDEMMHNLTLGSLLRHTCSSPVRGSGLHMLKLLKSDIQLVPSPLTPTTTFPDFAGGDCLDLESTPQLSFASWLLSNPSLAPFTKTVVGNKVQLFGHVMPEDLEMDGTGDEIGHHRLAWTSAATSSDLVCFDGFAADFRINDWNTAMVGATSNLNAATAPSPQDYESGNLLCDLFGYFAFLNFTWQSHPQAIVDRYYVRSDGTCKAVLPSSLLLHTAQYTPMLGQASAVLTHVTQHIISKLGLFLSIARGAAAATAILNAHFRQYTSSHLMCYIHREVLCAIIEGQEQDAHKLRMETDLVKKKLMELEGETLNPGGRRASPLLY